MGETTNGARATLPREGLSADAVRAALVQAEAGDVPWRSGKMHGYIYYAGDDVLQIAEIDVDYARAIEAAVFGDPRRLQAIDEDETAVLIEVVKDLFYQAYVRTAKLQAAVKMRRFFAGERERKVTPIERARRDPAVRGS